MHFQVQQWGGIEELTKLWRNNSTVPEIEWERYMQAECIASWHIFLKWPIKKRLFLYQEEDAAAAHLSDLFHDKLVQLPFRVPNLPELERDA